MNRKKLQLKSKVKRTRVANYKITHSASMRHKQKAKAIAHYLPSEKSDSPWKVVRQGENATIFFRPLDESFRRQMPQSAETFVERGFFRSFILRMQKFVKTGT